MPEPEIWPTPYSKLALDEAAAGTMYKNTKKESVMATSVQLSADVE